MFHLQVWQWLVVGAVAASSVGWMSLATIRLLTRRANAPATLRPGTDTESALVAGAVEAGSRVFDGWSYRVGARFAGRVRIAIYPDRVAVAGPRVPRRLYETWLWLQGLLLALVVPAFVAALIGLDWRWTVVSLVVLVVSFAVSMGGAGLWPGLGELGALEGGRFNALEFPRGLVREVDVGKGWSKGGLEVVLFPYKAGVDQMARGRAVSFFAPDENGHEVRFAIDAYTPERAEELAGLLRGDDVTGPA
jgi:hypothetical protein